MWPVLKGGERKDEADIPEQFRPFIVRVVVPVGISVSAGEGARSGVFLGGLLCIQFAQWALTQCLKRFITADRVEETRRQFCVFVSMGNNQDDHPKAAYLVSTRMV